MVLAYNNFDRASDLKIKILPANESPLHSHKFKTSLRTFNLSKKFSFSMRSVSQLLKIPKVRITEQFKLTHLQFIGVSFAPLFVPIQHASDLFIQVEFKRGIQLKCGAGL